MSDKDSLMLQIREALYNSRRDFYIKYNVYPSQLIRMSRDFYCNLVQDDDFRFSQMMSHQNPRAMKIEGWPFVVDDYNDDFEGFDIYVKGVAP